jgi:transposase InsO family protein
MIHLNIKKRERIEVVGHCIAGDRSRRKRGAGWKYLRVCVDDQSHLDYTELLAAEKAAISSCFLVRAAGWVERHGVTIDRVMSDNGSRYRSPFFLTTYYSLVAKPIKTNPYTPRTNGMAARFIQTSSRE